MTDEARTPTDADETRRARLAARRRRNVRVAVVAGITIVVAAVAFGVFALTSDDSSARPNTPSDEPVAAGPTELPEVAAAKKQATVRAISHEDPLRVWVGGDSLAGAFGPPLGDLLGASGVVQTHIDYKISSGLWGNDVRAWEERAAEQMTSSDPEVVVFMIGTNDTVAVNRVDNDDDGVYDWEELYREKVGRMMDLFVGGDKHRSVFFIGAPTLGTESMDDAAVELNRVFAEEAATRKEDIVYVDAYRLFSVPSGEYSRWIVDEKGEEIQARIGDGVHFTPSGANYLARTLFTLIDARWKVNKQADEAEPIAWTLAEGSGEQVPGYSERPQPRYYYDDDDYYEEPEYTPTVPPTVATTPPTTMTPVPEPTVPPTVATTPATKPPVTVPPVTVGEDDD
jgi:hypothetical protein